MTDSPRFRFILPVVMLRGHTREAELILRCSALANALLAVGRRMPEGATTSAERSDVLWASVVAAGYVHELARVLNGRRRFAWQLAHEGVDAGREFPAETPLDWLEELLRDGSNFRKSCLRIRNKYAFHFDPLPYRHLVSRPPAAWNGHVVLERVDGPGVLDVAFPAAYQALADAVPEALTPQFFMDVTRVMVAVSYLVEAMAVALVKRAGHEPNQFVEPLLAM